jgi:hypothetical protein
MTPTIPSHHSALLPDFGDRTRLKVPLKPRKQWRLSPTQRVSQESLEGSMTNEPDSWHSPAECNSSNVILSPPEMTVYADRHIQPFPFLPLSMASREPSRADTRLKPRVQLEILSTPFKSRLSNYHEASSTLVLNNGFYPIHPARNEGVSPTLVIRPRPIRYNQVCFQD